MQYLEIEDYLALTVRQEVFVDVFSAFPDLKILFLFSITFVFNASYTGSCTNKPVQNGSRPLVQQLDSPTVL